MKDLFKNKYILFTISAIIVGVIFFNQSSEKNIKSDRSASKSHMKKTQIQSPKDTKKTAKKDIAKKLDQSQKINKKIAKTNNKRTPASVKSYVGIKTINKYNKNWKKVAIRNLNKTLTEKYKSEITHVKQRLLRTGAGAKKIVEEVIIQIKHPTGEKSSYSAFINSETGKIEKTFNQSQFEKRDFYSPKLKFGYNTLEPDKLNKKK